MRKLVFFLSLVFLSYSFSLDVLVPNAIYQNLVERLGSEEVHVQTIVKQGGDSHHFDPTFVQYEALKNTQLWIRTGQAFEEKLKPQLSQSTELQLPASTPHSWLSFTKLKQEAKAISAALIQFNPEKKAEYEQRFSDFLQELELLESKARQKAKDSKVLAIATSHDAFSDLCNDLGIQQVSLDEKGKELSFRQALKIKQQMRALNVQTMIYIHPHGKKASEKWAKEMNLQWIFFDPSTGSILNHLNDLIDAIYGTDS